MDASNTTDQIQPASTFEADQDYGRISRLAYLGVGNALFGLAILALSARLVLKIRYRHRLSLDDLILIFGSLTLIAQTVLYDINTSDVFWEEEVLYGPPSFAAAAVQNPDFTEHMTQDVRMMLVTGILVWNTLFTVKLSYLVFFRQMIEKLPRLLVFWKVVLGITLVSYGYALTMDFISCPKTGSDALSCAQGSGFLRTVALSWLANALNMLTDILIVAIPITLLSSVDISLDRKLALGFFLCLSIAMVVICAVRASGTVSRHAVDLTWNEFMQQVESCIAVFVVSLTAFRGLYGSRKALREQRTPRTTWYVAARARWRGLSWFGSRSEEGEWRVESLPRVPRAEMTGIRTAIERAGGEKGEGDLESGNETGCKGPETIVVVVKE